ncbi:MAG: helix-turn-helix domain-containing protein [Myxococcaceae bacterium]
MYTRGVLLETGLKLVGVMPKKKQPLTEFGVRLTQLRQARGLTQVQLAQATGTTQRIVSRLETVAEFPTVPVLEELAGALRVSTDELLGLKAPPKVATPVRPVEEKRLLRQLRQVEQLPEKDKRAVLRLINSVAHASPKRSA